MPSLWSPTQRMKESLEHHWCSLNICWMHGFSNFIYTTTPPKRYSVMSSTLYWKVQTEAQRICHVPKATWWLLKVWGRILIWAVWLWCLPFHHYEAWSLMLWVSRKSLCLLRVTELKVRYKTPSKVSPTLYTFYSLSYTGFYWCFGFNITLIRDYFVDKSSPSLKYEYEMKVDILHIGRS